MMKKACSVLLVLAMVITVLPAGFIIASAEQDGVIPFAASASGAAVQSGYAAGDIITLGSYPQTKVTDAGLINTLNAQTLQEDNTVIYSSSKYKRVYFTQYTCYCGEPTTDTNYTYQDDNGYYINTAYWFKYEPIQWRILSNIKGELFVVAEKILESRAYNQDWDNVTWETSSMRAWLNTDFFVTAFNSTERSKIKTSTVINDDNPLFSTDGGINTKDKIFLLSCSDVVNHDYGFNSDSVTADPARRAHGSDFAKSNGLYICSESAYLGISAWWLRSPGEYQDSAGFVDLGGGVGIIGDYVDTASVGVRPAFRMNLTSDILTPKSGSNCVVNSWNKFIYGLDPGAASLEDYAETAPGYVCAYVPATGGFGTGTVVNVMLAGVIVESYTVIIFGDVTGDGNIDGNDAGTAVEVENFNVTWNPVSDAAKIKAADLNGDGNIDGNDAGLMTEVENYILAVNQHTGIAAVITTVEGTVAIGGTAKYGKTLMADISGLVPDGTSIKYTWKRAGEIIGFGSYYAVTAGDIGKSITVTVSGIWAYTDSIRSAAVTPTKADVSAPLAPVLLSKTANSVTLTAVEGREYRIGSGEWQASSVFTGLSPNTVYSFYARIAETATHFASPASEVLNVSTGSNTISGTVTISGTPAVGETLTADISGLLPVGATISYKWKADGTQVGTGNTYSVIDADIGCRITVTVTGTGIYNGSVTSAGVLIP